MTMLKKFLDGMDFTGGFFKFIKGEMNLTKSNDADAGLDLYSTESLLIYPGDRALVSTGIQVEIIPGYVGLVFARSGLAVKNGIMVGAGVIDSTYRGELKVLLFNMGKNLFTVCVGDRIAQMLTVPINLGMYTSVDMLSNTERGTDGFGSTGR